MDCEELQPGDKCYNRAGNIVYYKGKTKLPGGLEYNFVISSSNIDGTNKMLRKDSMRSYWVTRYGYRVKTRDHFLDVIERIKV